MHAYSMAKEIKQPGDLQKPLVTCRWQQAGQVLISVAGPATMCIPSTLSVAWFPVHQRVSATAASVIASGVGASMPFFIGKHTQFKIEVQ